MHKQVLLLYPTLPLSPLKNFATQSDHPSALVADAYVYSFEEKWK